MLCKKGTQSINFGYHILLIYLPCIEVWGSCNLTTISSLFKLQKRALRVITTSEFNAPTDHLFEIMCVLPLNKIYMYYISMFMYKFNKNQHPRIVNVLFQRNAEVHNVNARQSRDLHVPFTRSSMYSKLDLKAFLYGTK